MAHSVHLFLKANGADIKGESTQTSLGRENTIECLHYEQAVTGPRDAATGAATGKRQYAPIVIRKRIDKASPLLEKALTENQAIEATFKFFRPNPTGDGTTEQFYTVQIKQGRLAAIKDVVEDTVAAPNEAPMQEVSFVFRSISWTYTNGGITHQDTFQ